MNSAAETYLALNNLTAAADLADEALALEDVQQLEPISIILNQRLQRAESYLNGWPEHKQRLHHLHQSMLFSKKGFEELLKKQSKKEYKQLFQNFKKDSLMNTIAGIANMHRQLLRIWLNNESSNAGGYPFNLSAVTTTCPLPVNNQAATPGNLQFTLNGQPTTGNMQVLLNGQNMPTNGAAQSTNASAQGGMTNTSAQGGYGASPQAGYGSTAQQLPYMPATCPANSNAQPLFQFQ